MSLTIMQKKPLSTYIPEELKNTTYSAMLQFLTVNTVTTEDDGLHWIFIMCKNCQLLKLVRCTNLCDTDQPTNQPPKKCYLSTPRPVKLLCGGKISKTAYSRLFESRTVPQNKIDPYYLVIISHLRDSKVRKCFYGNFRLSLFHAYLTKLTHMAIGTYTDTSFVQ